MALHLSPKGAIQFSTRSSSTLLQPRFAISKLILRTLDWMSLYFYRNREFLFHVISTYVFCWVSFIMLVILSICFLFAWVGGGYLHFLPSFFYSCDYIFITYRVCDLVSASFDLWALSYILLCIGIGSVYTDGIRFLGFGF
jgi:hypothetical protein